MKKIKSVKIHEVKRVDYGIDGYMARIKYTNGDTEITSPYETMESLCECIKQEYEKVKPRWTYELPSHIQANQRHIQGKPVVLIRADERIEVMCCNEADAKLICGAHELLEAAEAIDNLYIKGCSGCSLDVSDGAIGKMREAVAKAKG